MRTAVQKSSSNVFLKLIQGRVKQEEEKERKRETRVVIGE